MLNVLGSSLSILFFGVISKYIMFPANKYEKVVIDKNSFQGNIKIFSDFFNSDIVTNIMYVLGIITIVLIIILLINRKIIYLVMNKKVGL